MCKMEPDLFLQVNKKKKMFLFFETFQSKLKNS